PGVSIYSTLRGNTYGWLTGGSMASPQVAGAAALILSVSPNLSTAELKADILTNVDKLSSFEGKVETGGRLDVCKALPGCGTAPPPPPPQEETLGKAAIGATKGYFGLERKPVNRHPLPHAGLATNP